VAVAGRPLSANHGADPQLFFLGLLLARGDLQLYGLAVADVLAFGRLPRPGAEDLAQLGRLDRTKCNTAATIRHTVTEGY
jgi:hypothetical protein